MQGERVPGKASQKRRCPSSLLKELAEWYEAGEGCCWQKAHEKPYRLLKKLDSWRSTGPCIWPESKSQFGNWWAKGQVVANSCWAWGDMPRSLDLFWGQWGGLTSIRSGQVMTVTYPGWRRNWNPPTRASDICDKVVAIGWKEMTGPEVLEVDG